MGNDSGAFTIVETGKVITVRVADPTKLDLSRSSYDLTTTAVFKSTMMPGATRTLGTVQLSIPVVPTANVLPTIGANGAVTVLPTLVLTPRDFANAVREPSAFVKARVDAAIGANEFENTEDGSRGIIYNGGESAFDFQGSVGKAGFVIAWDLAAKPTADGMAFDFSGVKMKILVWRATLSEREGEQIEDTQFGLTATVPGARNTTQHESWHAYGPSELYGRLITEFVRQDPSFLKSAVYGKDERRIGYFNAAEKVKNDFVKAMNSSFFIPTPGTAVLTDAAAKEKAVQFFGNSVKGKEQWILWQGTWHKPKESGFPYELNSAATPNELNE